MLWKRASYYSHDIDVFFLFLSLNIFIFFYFVFKSIFLQLQVELTYVHIVMSNNLIFCIIRSYKCIVNTQRHVPMIPIPAYTFITHFIDTYAR